MPKQKKVKDGGHLKIAYQNVIRDLKKSFNTCNDYDGRCIECRANKARELLEEVVELGFE